MNNTPNPSLDLAIENRVESEQLKLLFKEMPPAIFTSILIASVLIYIEWDFIAHEVATAWFVSLIVVTLIRFGMGISFQKHLRNQTNENAPWDTYFSVGSVAAGIIWGSSAFLLFPENQMAHQVFLAFILGGLSAGAITSLSPLKFPIISFLILVLSPLIIRFLMEGSEIAAAMAGMTFLFLISLLANALRTYSNIRENINLRMHSEQQEDVLFKSKQELQAILDNAPVGIWLVGTDGRYRYVNSTFCNAVGHGERDFLEMSSLANLLGENVAANWLESDQACFDSDSPHISKELIPFVDGKEHLMEITKAKVLDKEGNIAGSVGVAVDISENHAVAEKLRKISQAVEQAGESIIITDKSGVIEYTNPAFTKITGFEPEEVLGKNPRILKSGNQTAEYYERLWKTISQGKTWHSSVMDKRRDGSLYPALMTISPILNRDGDITHYVGIQQDMTDQNKLEEQFRQAQKMEALGTLVGGIAHDFNNILTGITGNLDMAMYETEHLPEVTEKLKIAEELSFKAADMIKQLMVFSRKGLVKMKPFGLISFVENISVVIKTTIPENISFQLETCTEEIIVRGDNNQIEQVMLNMLNNARYAVSEVKEPKISLVIDIFTADTEFENRYPNLTGSRFAHIMIKDNGGGIAEADKKHIFEPFFTTKDVGLGTGLGLSMAYGVIKGHKGVLEVESELGKGAEFHIYLPIEEEKAIDLAPMNKSEIIFGNEELVLVVDDNADVRVTVKNILISLNYKVLEAVDGLDAVDVFSTNRDEISLVIMDVVMPRLGGVKAVERICKIRPDIKIIFSTGYDKDASLSNEMPSDEFDILPKPFNVAKLSGLIKKRLHGG